MRTLRRRRYLAGIATASVAGCLGGTDGGDGNSGDAGSGADGGQPNDAGGSGLADHPAAADLDVQPRLGPAPDEATATIIAFEDPSCPRCRAFEQQTVPKIRSNLVAPGTGSFVFRGFPVVYEWGKPATRALEAVYDRDADALWQLAAHYFEQQSSFGTDNVLAKTRTFVAENTDLDADAVVAAVEDGSYDDAVSLDLDAGKKAGASATPTVFLFKDGQYRTKAAGSVSYSVIENALGL
jgi:protein-disulfide isomerase